MSAAVTKSVDQVIRDWCLQVNECPDDASMQVKIPTGNPTYPYIAVYSLRDKFLELIKDLLKARGLGQVCYAQRVRGVSRAEENFQCIKGEYHYQIAMKGKPGAFAFSLAHSCADEIDDLAFNAADMVGQAAGSF